jgi:Adenylate and Guanylate cyclase catalytic domain
MPPYLRRCAYFDARVLLAARIESTGQKNRIHLSEQAAAELMKHGKQDWVVRRQDTVEAKGKGKLVTYWLTHTTNKNGTMSVVSSCESPDLETSERPMQAVDKGTPIFFNESSTSSPPLDHTARNKEEERIQRLVDWNSDLLLQLLQGVAARREALPGTYDAPVIRSNMNCDGAMAADEVVEIIEMPPFVSIPTVEETTLSEAVVKELRNFVATIASLYNENPCKYLP